MKRWLIRSVFMLPLLLCVVGWGWSGSQRTWIDYCPHDRVVDCDSLWGVVGVQWGTLTGQPDWWVYGTTETSNAQFWPTYRSVDSFLGFRYFHARTTTRSTTRLQAPLWFLIIVFSAILYVVWRKTRPRGTGRAFPVELTAPRSESDEMP